MKSKKWGKIVSFWNEIRKLLTGALVGGGVCASGGRAGR